MCGVRTYLTQMGPYMVLFDMIDSHSRLGSFDRQWHGQLPVSSHQRPVTGGQLTLTCSTGAEISKSVQTHTVNTVGWLLSPSPLLSNGCLSFGQSGVSASCSSRVPASGHLISRYASTEVLRYIHPRHILLTVCNCLPRYLGINLGILHTSTAKCPLSIPRNSDWTVSV